MTMDRILFGDNQFFGVNHLSDEKARAQAVKFQDIKAVISVLDQMYECGINTFMCTTHDRIALVCDHIRTNPKKYERFQFYPGMPYAHKYANAVTDFGIVGAIRQYVPGNLIGSLVKGGISFATRDYLSMMRLLVDAEMKMFKRLQAPVIFLQNVVTDLVLGLGMVDFLVEFVEYIRKKYDAEAGFITMNLPMLLLALEEKGVKNPIICASINKIGFRMSGGREVTEKVLSQGRCRAIAMQVLAAGALRPSEAMEYVCGLKGVESILFGASSRAHIEETKQMIEKFDRVVK